MYRCGAVHCNGGNDPALHEIDDDRREADLDDVRSHQHNARAIILAEQRDLRHKLTEVLRFENIRKAFNERAKRPIGVERRGETAHGDFAHAVRDRDGLNV